MASQATPSDHSILPRVAAQHLTAAAAVMPVVVVMGARQTGKSTLVRSHPVFGKYPYVTLDNSDIREQAAADPAGLLARAPHLVIDEVQRDPELILSLKEYIDNQPRRTPGQFVLTGSANLLAMKKIRESLAGRASYTTLWPMTRRERLGFGTAGLWDEYQMHPFSEWYAIANASPNPQDDWRTLVSMSGYPTPALDCGTAAARAIWYQGYIDTYLDRDLQDLASIANRTDFRRLMRVAALRIGALVNKTQWGRDAGIPPTTVDRYLDLLETSYQLVRISAYSVNRAKRLIKSPKCYWSDTGLAMYIAGEVEPNGFHLENMVLCDLLAWRDSLAQRPSIMHWRTTAGDEVDFVIELPDQTLIAIECKGGSRPGHNDATPLRSFLAEYGSKVRGALLLHGGTETYKLGDRVLATPWWRIL
jgi:predicted AAA+ superfamily ATPase